MIEEQQQQRPENKSYTSFSCHYNFATLVGSGRQNRLTMNSLNMMGQSHADDEFDGPEITEAMHLEQLQESLRKFWNDQITEMQLLDIGLY